jgi:hypothetical protein
MQCKKKEKKREKLEIFVNLGGSAVFRDGL